MKKKLAIMLALLMSASVLVMNGCSSTGKNSEYSEEADEDEEEEEEDTKKSKKRDRSDDDKDEALDEFADDDEDTDDYDDEDDYIDEDDEPEPEDDQAEDEDLTADRNNSGNNTQIQPTSLTPYNTLDNCGMADIKMSGTIYKEAMQFTRWSGSLLPGEGGTVYYNLSGSYTTVSGLFGTVDDSVFDAGSYAEISFYGDGTLLKTYTVVAAQVVEDFEVDVTGVTQLTITCENNSDKTMNTVGLGDMYFK